MDLSSEQWNVVRSFNIQRRIALWLNENEDVPFTNERVLEGMAANRVWCAMPTAHRWLFQFTLPGERWQIENVVDGADGDGSMAIIRRRGDAEGSMSYRRLQEALGGIRGMAAREKEAVR